MALAQYRPDVSSYFASMSPLAGRIMAALEDGEEIIQDDVTRLYERSSRGPPALEVTTEVSVFPKFVPDPTRKIIVDEQDGKTWEDEYSGQFSWETRSQLELDFSSFEDVSSGVTPGVPRRRLESGDVDGAASPVASVASPSNGKGVRKAKLVTNWLDSPVLKAMQENSSNSDGFEDGPSRETSPEAQPKSDSDPDSADLFSKFGITFTLGPGNESTTDEDRRWFEQRTCLQVPSGEDLIQETQEKVLSWRFDCATPPQGRRRHGKEVELDCFPSQRKLFNWLLP